MTSSKQNPDFEQLIADLPGSEGQLAQDVVVLAEDGEELQAESILRLALRKHSSSRLRIALAHVLIRQNRHKEAMTEMVGVLRSDPENADALLVLATCLMECGELDRGGKMLQKARLSGVDEAQARLLEERWHALVAKSTNPGFADLTLPDIGKETGGVVASNPEPTGEREARKRHETLMGRPTTDRLEDPPNFDVGDPTGMTASNPSGASPQSLRLPPPPLQSGTFDSLGDWDLDHADENDLDTTAIAPDKLRLSDEGPLERIPMPSLAESSGEFARPEDMTAAIVLDDDDLATPDELTAHIPYKDVERGLKQIGDQGGATVERDMEQMPSVQYDASFAAEARLHQQEQPDPGYAPPADLDDLPSYNSDLAGLPHEQHTQEDHWDDFAQPATAPAELEERAVARSSIDYGDWNDIPSVPQGHGVAQIEPHALPPSPTAQPGFDDNHGFQPASLHGHANEESFRVQGNSVPIPAPRSSSRGPAPAPRPRRESTDVAGAPTSPGASGSLRSVLEKRWMFVLVGLLAVVLIGFLGLTIASGLSLASSLKSGMQTASTSRENDTFSGFVAAEQKLADMTTAQSFMGSGFDRFVETTLPIPGLSGAGLRRRAVADLAAVSAVLEYRFEKAGSRNAAERLVAAKDLAPDEPATAVAEAYASLSKNEPAAAISVLEGARTRHPEDTRLTEALGWSLLAMGRPAEAAQVTQSLGDLPAPTVHQRFVLASVSAARGDEKAASALAQVFAASPDHADARIARSYALMGGDEKALADGQRALDAVLTKLAEATSSYQKARATSAYGSLHLVSGKKEAGEERLRSAVAKMPTRGELYLPLLAFLESASKHDEIDALLEKAQASNAYTVDLALYEARHRLLQSKPERAQEVLEGLEFDDGRKAFLQGWSLLDQYKPQKAREVLEAGQNAPGESLHARAMYYVARSLASSDAVEDAGYQLERMKSKNADSAIVHWAAAVVAAAAAEITPSRKTRTQQLKVASEDAQRAFELDATWPPIHFTRCDIFLREQNAEKAEEFCFSGRTLAPDYAPGLVTTARMRLMEGKFDDAKELADRALTLRPNDPVVGLLAARVAIERRELDKASELLNRWLGKAVDKYEHSLLEGRVEFARENYTRAVGYLKAAYELRPNEGEASIYYGHTLARIGEYGQASKLLREYLSHPTWSGYAWAVLGEVRRKQKKLKDAYENLNKAISIYREQSVPLRYWSHVYTEYALANHIKYRKWRHPQVKRMLDRARKKGDPDDPGLNMTYGQYYLNLRKPDYSAAMNHIQKVVDVAPFRCDAVAALRDLYKRAKREDVDTIDDIYAKNCASE